MLARWPKPIQAVLHRPGECKGAVRSDWKSSVFSPPNGCCCASAEHSREPLKSDFVLAGSVCLQSDRAAVAHCLERHRDRGVVDLARAWFTTAGHIGDLHLADQRVSASQQLDQVPFTDLGVVEVEHHPQPGPVYRLDERERVLRTGER